MSHVELDSPIQHRDPIVDLDWLPRFRATMANSVFPRLPGFRDFPPEEFALRTHICEAWRRVARRYGFLEYDGCLLYTSPSPRDLSTSRMPSSA